MKIADVFTSKKFIVGLLLISISMALLSLVHRETGTDDAWFAEQSYWFSKNGYVRSNLFDGLNNFGENHLTYHRLHVWQGALMLKMYGWSSYAFKFILLTYFLIFLLAVYGFLKSNKIFTDSSQYVVFYSLSIAYSIMVLLIFTNRPDITVMTFGFLSFAKIYSSLNKQQTLKIIIAGLFAGLAVLTHLNGLVFVVAGGVLLLYAKNYRQFWYFGVTSCVVSLLYFIIIQDMSDVRLYLQQMSRNPALSEDDYSISGSLWKLLSSHKSYFHKGSDASYTLLFVMTFWWQRKRIFANEAARNTFIYFVSIAITLALISPGYKSMYLVYHAPYAFILIALLYKEMFTLSVIRQRAFAVLLCLYFLTQWGEVGFLFNKRTPGMSVMHENVSKSLGIEQGDRIIAPITFVFNEVEKYNIKTFHVYRLRGSRIAKSLEKEFFRLASEDRRKYLILYDYDMEDMHIKDPVKGGRFGNYVYQGKYGPYHGFKHI